MDFSITSYVVLFLLTLAISTYAWRHNKKKRIVWILADVAWVMFSVAAFISAIYAINEAIVAGDMQIAVKGAIGNRDAIVYKVWQIEDQLCDGGKSGPVSVTEVCNKAIPMIRRELQLQNFTNTSATKGLKALKDACASTQCPPVVSEMKFQLERFEQDYLSRKSVIESNYSESVLKWANYKLLFIVLFTILFPVRLGRSISELADYLQSDKESGGKTGTQAQSSSVTPELLVERAATDSIQKPEAEPNTLLKEMASGESSPN